MFGAKKKKAEGDEVGVMQKSSRGNMDEYEALRTIVAENAGLLNRVLDKIRVQRVLSGKSQNAATSEAEAAIKENNKKGPR